MCSSELEQCGILAVLAMLIRVVEWIAKPEQTVLACSTIKPIVEEFFSIRFSKCEVGIFARSSIWSVHTVNVEPLYVETN